MTISAFELYKVGIGPSSSHTVGPMRAANTFVTRLATDGLLTRTAAVRAEMFGSLGVTGHGHGTVKAVTAARLAVRGDGRHQVSIDKAIKTMRETGADMKDKYKETALGGLAVNVIEC